MAHGFLTPQSVSGDNFWQNANWLWEKLSKAKIWPLSKKQDLIYAHTTEIRNLLKAGQQKKLTGVNQKALPAGKTPLLGPGAGALAKRNGGIVEKNPTNIDVREGRKQLTPGGPKLPGDTGESVSKGGSFVDLGSTQAKPLNAENFFAKAQTGVGDSGEYLTKAQRIADFRKSQEMRAASSAAPGISADSGVDIVAAVNRNTQMMVSLVEAVKAQTSNDSKIANYQAETQQKFMLRAAASKKEDELEKNKDLSGFMTPENLRKREEGKLVAGGGGGGRNRFDDAMTAIDLAGDINDIRRGKTRRVLPGRDGRTSRERLRDMKMRKAGLTPRSSSGSLSPRGGLSTGRALGAARSGGLGKGLGGAAKGAGRGVPGLNVLLAGLEFGDRMGSGQSALQAGVGTAGSIGGGMAGAAAGAALGSIVPGVGTLIGGLIGGALGSMTGGGLADRLTGANDVTPMADGGVLVGEAGLEGVFPLAGPKGKKTFSLFGEGILDAQTDNKQEFAKLQSAGLKQYYEKEGGFEKMGEGLKGLFDGLGNVLNSILTPPANAGTLDSAADYLTDGSVEGNKRAILAAIKDAGYDNRAASNMLAQIQGESGFKMQSEQSYRNTSADRIKLVMGQRAAKYSNEQLDILKKDDKKFFDAMYGNDMGNAADEGYKYRGRGFIQLTGKNNYKKIGDMIGVDLVGNPELMNDPAVAAKASVAFFKSVGANNQNMSTMKGAYQAVYRGNPNATSLDGKDQLRIAQRSVSAAKFYSDLQSGQLTGDTARVPSPAGAGGKVIEYLTGDKSSKNYRADHGGGNYHDHIAFDSKATRDAAAAWLKTKGWKIGSMNDGKHADGSYHYSDKAFDIPFYPNQRIKGVTDDGKGETKLSTMLRNDLAKGGFSGSGIAALPGAPTPASPSAPVATANGNPNRRGQGARRSATGSTAGSVKPATPAPVPAVAASTNPGTNVLASSQQVAMGTMGLTASAPTVINNYYTTASGANQGMAGNGVGPGITMNGAAGVAWINQLAAMTRV